MPAASANGVGSKTRSNLGAPGKELLAACVQAGRGSGSGRVALLRRWSRTGRKLRASAPVVDVGIVSYPREYSNEQCVLSTVKEWPPVSRRRAAQKKEREGLASPVETQSS